MSDKESRGDGALDTELSRYYSHLADAPVPDKLHGRIVGTLQARLDKQASGRRSHRLPRLAAGAIAVVAIVAIAAAALPIVQIVQRGPVRPGEPTPSASATGSAALSASTTALPTPSLAATSNAGAFATDPRLKLCGGLEAGIDTVVALDHAWAYRAVLPGIGFVPQLDWSSDPALMVVYSGPVPPELDWRNHISRPAPLPGTTQPAPTPVPTLPPGSRNVCVAVAGAQQPLIVEKVRTAPIHPEMASLAVRPPASVGEGRVVARNKNSTYSLAWDAARGALWYTVQSPTDSALYRLDPSTGETKRWALRATDYNGFIDMVVVDGSGDVWFDTAGTRLYRLDPKTGQLGHYDVSGKGGTSIWAIAPDGNGVLIARDSLAYLTRIDAGLHEVERIPIPTAYEGAGEMGVVGDRVILGGKPDVFGLFTRQGDLVKTLPLQPWSLVGPGRILAAGPGRVAIYGDKEFVLVDASGDVVSHVPLALDLPIGSFGDTGMFESTPEPQSIATDWKGTFWYVLGTYVVEVRSP